MSLRTPVLIGALLLSMGAARAASRRPAMPPDLDKYIQAVLPGIDTIPDDRKEELRKLAAFVRAKTEAGAPAELLFICTHNSRRSQMGQIWAATAAAWYGVRGVRTFSGGTEATAFNPRAVAAMRRAGFQIDGPDGTNPHYRVTYTSDGPPLEAFSKKFVDPPNPQSDFAAVMTCGVADKACPIVHGAALRVPLHYEDPKDADGTPAEAATYDARARQIATEMFFLFAQVAQAGAPAH